MISGYVDRGLLEKQAAGIPLTSEEARIVVCGLRKFIKTEPGDMTLQILMLGIVSSKYYEDVWDILISIEEGQDNDPACG